MTLTQFGVDVVGIAFAISGAGVFYRGVKEQNIVLAAVGCLRIIGGVWLVAVVGGVA